MAQNTTHPERSRERRSEPSRPRAVDAVVVGGNEVWVLVARPGEDPADLLWSCDGDDRLRICKAVLEGGVLVMGDADPDRDPLLSEILRGEDRGASR
jgi:hypothetical protein